MTKEDFKEKVLNYILEVEFGPLLELNYDIAEAYDNGEITEEDFYDILEEIQMQIQNNE